MRGSPSPFSARWAATPRWDEGWIDGKRHALGPYEKPTFENTGRRLYEQAIVEMSRPGVLPSWGQIPGRWRQEAPEEQERWVESLASVYSLLHDAADQPYCSPLEPDAVSADSPFDNRDRLASLTGLRLHVDRRAGRFADSLEGAADGIALGVNTMQHGGSTDFETGWSVIATVSQWANPAIADGGLPAEDYLDYADRVRELHSRVPSVEAILTVEAARCRDAVAALTEKAAVSEACRMPSWITPTTEQRLRRQVLLWTWDRARSTEWIEDRCARLAEQCRQPIDAAAVIALVERSGPDLEARRDPVAESHYEMVKRVAYYWISLHACLTADETVARLEAYRARHGNYPPSLADLVPDFAPETPLDPWSGEPLRYRAGRPAYRLYSVGRNQADDGGVGTLSALVLQPDDVYVAPPLETGEWPAIVQPKGAAPVGGMFSGGGM